MRGLSRPLASSMLLASSIVACLRTSAVAGATPQPDTTLISERKIAEIPSEKRRNFFSAYLRWNVGMNPDHKFGMAFSPDGKRIAYVAESAGWHVVLDGQPQKEYDEIDTTTLIFSPDSRRLAYAAKVDDDWCIVVDGVEGKLYDEVLPPEFSPDSRRVVHYARKGKQKFVDVDGDEYGPYEETSRLRSFSPDSRSLAYGALLEDMNVLMIDGLEQARHELVWEVAFAPNGRLGYVAQDSKRWFAVIGGEKQKEYERVLALTFSPDGGRWAHIAVQDDEEFVVVDGQEGPRYPSSRKEGIIESPVFSPDSRHVAYAVNDDGRHFVVVDHTPDPPYDNIVDYSIAFSPDSRRTAYLADDDGDLVAVIDGQPGPPYPIETEGYPAPVFSPDSRSMAYVVTRDERIVLVVNGVEVAQTDGVGPVVFDGPERFHYIELREEGAYLIERRVP